MDFAIGFFTGAFVTWATAYVIVKEWKKEKLEKLKDFDTWKEWKNETFKSEQYEKIR